MAQFVHQYVSEMLRRQHAVSQAYPDVLGTDPMYTSRQLYNLNLMNLMLLGVIMKKVSEVGGVTDQQWLDALDHAIDSSVQLPWPTWVINQDISGM